MFAGSWGLRYAIGASLAAALIFDYYFLPPIGTFTISDTQNWVALFTFLGTALYASHLASRIREESHEADTRRLESEMLYRLGRQLLQPENVAQLLNFIPSSVANAFNSPAVTLYLADGDRIYLSDPKRISSPNVAWNPGDTPGSTGIERTRAEIVHDLREAMLHPVTTSTADGFPAVIPLRVGVRPSGAVLLEATTLSRETMEGLSGLVSMSIERAEALEDSARSKAAKETERLRTALLDSVTHELRTPLTSIKASITSLLSQQALDAPAQEGPAHRHRRGVRPPQPPHRTGGRDVATRRPQGPTGDETAVHRGFNLRRGRAVPFRPTLPRLPRLPLQLPAQRARRQGLDREGAGQPAGKRQPNTPRRINPSSSPPTPRRRCSAISVADRGAGIDPLEQGMIFDKFYRGPSQRSQVSGTGMGLAICRAIITAHGGAIGVTSQLGHGSVFTFTLPIAAPEPVRS